MATATANSPTDGPPLAPRLPHARSMCPIRSSCSATQINAPTSPTACVPIVRVAPRSATGAAVAGPSTIWRATERPRTGSGFVAKFWEEATQASTRRLIVNPELGRESEQLADKVRLADCISFGQPSHSALPDHVHCLDSLQRPPRALKGSIALGQPNSFLNRPVVLFNHVIEITCTGVTRRGGGWCRRLSALPPRPDRLGSCPRSSPVASDCPMPQSPCGGSVWLRRYRVWP